MCSGRDPHLLCLGVETTISPVSVSEATRSHQEQFHLLSAGSPFGFALSYTFPKVMGLCTQVLPLCKPLINQQRCAFNCTFSSCQMFIKCNFQQLRTIHTVYPWHQYEKQLQQSISSCLTSRVMHRDHPLLVGARVLPGVPDSSHERTTSRLPASLI